MKNDLAVFEGHEIRRVYDEQTETWWFSVVDIIRGADAAAELQAAQNTGKS